ncbi:PREDICTED: pentatricopeptide repeat-containing protein At2g38420, mitochondrial-like [Fragaria vesca subsp. vesca]|uniref:pentatricopeptide repeat-containing protein At2g38420, mitochondrial n=1 Tax=Fragaria vesca subsp. vesca TaxID=101020 RepID=UPI0002C367FE|nr:PREDICTED: pentatricopeptide repeat-containing protein At2g38420, mitochondrial [Fragaria vesca subsp. vesca]
MVRTSSLTPRSKFFVRKHRKWPVSPYNTKWHKLFNQHQALQTLKHSPLNPPQTLLSTLIHSFNTFNCDPTPEAYNFVLKTLFKTSQLSHIPSVLDRLESIEKFHPPESIFANLIRFYGSANRVEDAIDVFCRIPKFRCDPSAVSLNSLLYVLCGSSEGLKMVPQVLMNSRAMGIRLEESSFRILISALCRIGSVGYAIEIMKCMISNGYDLDVKICSLVLSSLCEQKGVGGLEVVGFVEEMKKVGFCPGMLDYSNVIRCLVKQGKGLDALRVLCKMKVEGMKPDIVCYTMVLYGVIANGDYKNADKVFDELLVLGLVPDVYTYNVYINGLCNQNNVEAGIKMITCMDELGCRPNLITYNLLLKALCKNEELSRARELVSEMTLNGVGVNLQTHIIMLDGLFCKGDVDEACIFMEEMLDKFMCRRCSAYDDVIYGLCQRGLVCKAMDLLLKMVDKNVVPGARAWEALLLSSGTGPCLVENTWTNLVNPMEVD